MGKRAPPLFYWLGLLRPLQLPVALVVDKWLAVVNGGLQSFAEEDAVIACVDQPVKAAFESRQSTGNQRHRITAFAPIDTIEAVIGAGGEAVADVLLLAGEDAEAEVRGLAEGWENSRAVVDADEH